jgi:hypothetical protein
MKTIRLALTLVFLFPLLAAGVVAQNRKPATPVRDFFPLRVGDSWTYRQEETDTEYTVKVLSAEKQADGSTRYQLEKQAGAQIQSWYSKTDGWVLMHGETYVGQQLKSTYEPARRFLSNPLVAGEKWTWKGKTVTNIDVIEFNEVVGSETVKVPAGTFRAMKIISKVDDGGAAMTKTYWYADGVGLVKTTTEGGQIKYGWELKDYSFKKGGQSRNK